MRLHRRAVLAAASLAATPFPAWARDLARGAFTHGVASGDPASNSVILWTRFVPQGDGDIAWEVSEDENFTRIAARGEARASAASDYCVKTDAAGLQPGQRYFYRFLAASGPSVTGMTRTAPQAGAESLNIAFFSCANLPFGYFHAYGHAAQRDDVDLVLHLGDYIYETPRGVYPSAQDAVPGRIIDPIYEIVSLNDYYQRYGAYHSDSDLLELRRRKPMSTVWDDHELVNDTWRGGAKDHNREFEGDFSARMAAASKAYFDWMPIRRPDPRGLRLYRTLDWGNLARIVLLDARFIGRDQQLTTPRQLLDGADIQSARHAFTAQLDDPNRTILGRAQEDWFAQKLAESKARGQTWQVLAQQVMMGQQIAPQGLTRFLPPSRPASSGRWFVEGEALGQLGLPWNFDNWNGYPAARIRFLDACVQHGANAIVLGGDSHNCWLHNHPHENRMAAIEFAAGSVTSPGFEKTLTNAQPGEREAAMRAANPDLAWCDVTRRGYGVMRLTRSACEAEWLGFDSVRAPQAPAPLVTRFASEPSQNAGPGAWITQA
jgi:alkaline phosphatase D